MNLYESIKNNLNETEYVVKIWVDAAEDYQDYNVYPTKEEAQAEANALKANGEKAIVEEFREASRDPELTDEVEWYNRNFNEGDLPNISKFIYDLDVNDGNSWSVQDYTKNGRGDKIIVVSRNGQSNNSAEDIIKAVEKSYPNLKGEPTVNGRAIWFYLKESSLKESTEPEEDKELPFEERVNRAYLNCNYSDSFPTISDVINYMEIENNSENRAKVSDIIYKLGYDWQVESYDESEEINPLRTDLPGVFCCNDCGNEFEEYSMGEGYTCPYCHCGDIFRTSRLLKCNSCGKMFDETQMEDSAQVNDDFKCPYCNSKDVKVEE